MDLSIFNHPLFYSLYPSLILWVSPFLLVSFGSSFQFCSSSNPTTTTPHLLLPTSKYSRHSSRGMQTGITLVLKDLPAVCRLLHDCISQNDRISNFVDISNFVIQKYSKFLWLQIKGQIIYSLTGIWKTLKTVFWSISKL